MLSPENQPSIEAILDDYGISDMLGPNLYGQLLAELEERDTVLLTDAAEHGAKKHIIAALNKIIQEV